MSTSNSINFTQSQIELIQDAFTLIGRYSIGKTLSPEDLAIAQRFLNKMVKAWSAKGLHLWAKEEGILFLTPYVGEYSLSSTSGVKFSTKDDSTTTKLTSSAITTATSLTVESTTGMVVSDKIGVVLDTGYLQWTTIAAIPSSTSVTINAALTGAAASGNLLYSYTTIGNKPLRILSCRLMSGLDSGTTTTQTEWPMTSIGYEDYYNIAMQTTSGPQPNQFHYNPKVSDGKLLVWPRPTTAANRIAYTFERTLQDLDTVTDNFDFPGEWLECLTYQLAVRLGPIYGKDARAMQVLAPIASSLLEDLLDWDNEITSVRFTPERGGYE